MTVPVRTLSLCAGCGEVRQRDELCPECGLFPEADMMPCEECEEGVSRVGRMTKPIAAMASPDDGVEWRPAACDCCNGSREVSRPFAGASEEWARGFEEALREVAEGNRQERCYPHFHAGLTAGRGWLASLPAHQGFESPPPPVFRPTVEQMDTWAAQNLTWREHIKQLCPACGFFGSEGRQAALAGLGEKSCGYCATALIRLRRGERSGMDGGLAKLNHEFPRGLSPHGRSPLWRRFDAGEMRDLDFRFDGGAA